MPRVRRLLTGRQAAARIRIQGRERVNFAGNDYLAMAAHPAVIEAAAADLSEKGLGSGGSQYMTGYGDSHHRLEQAIADFTGRPRCLIFSSGYLANLAVLTALADKGDFICADRLSHASFIDALNLARVRFVRYRHCDPVSMQRCLSRAADRRTIVWTEGVYSMDGDIPPLLEYTALCRRHDALLMVDDAHGFGVMGPTGAGVLEAAGLSRSDVPVLIGTFGKALGGSGAFVAGDDVMIDILEQKARPLIYTTSPPSCVMAGVAQALSLIAADGSESWRRQSLLERVRFFKETARNLELNFMPSDTPIQPYLLGSPERARLIAEQLLEKGFYVPAICYPTVPQGQERLRVSLRVDHTDEDIENMLQCLSRLVCAGR